MSLDHKAHVEHASPVEPSVVESKTPWFKTLTGKIAVGAAALVTAAGIGVGVGASVNNGEGRQEPSVGAPQNPTPEASPTETVPTPEATETGSDIYTGVEAIGQNEEIARDQLNILQQTTSVEAMLKMSDEELANESVGNRAALGYYLTKKILLDNQQEYNINPIDADIISFYHDPANKIRSGGFILDAIADQTSSLTRATPEEARALAFSHWYRTVDGAGNILPHVQDSIEFNQNIAAMDIIEIRKPAAVKETGWFKHSEGEWVKVIEEQALGDKDLKDLDRTIQHVRTTVTLDNGETVFFYMKGWTSEPQAGDLVEEYVEKPLGPTT